MYVAITISPSILGLSLAWPNHARLIGAMHTEQIEKCIRSEGAINNNIKVNGSHTD